MRVSISVLLLDDSGKHLRPAERWSFDWDDVDFQVACSVESGETINAHDVLLKGD